MSRELQIMNQQNKLTLWVGRIMECRNSGQNVKVRCKENGICKQTYYRWQKHLFELAKAQQEETSQNHKSEEPTEETLTVKAHSRKKKRTIDELAKNFPISF